MPMLTAFEFEKWYFDFTCPGGEIVFFFLARTRILGLRDDRLSLTVVSPGKAPIHRSFDLRRPGSSPEPIESPLGQVSASAPSRSDREVRVRAGREDVSLDLAFVRHRDDRPAANPMFIPLGRRRRVLWEPVQGRSVVRGLVRLAGREFVAEGCDGYIDRLVSDVFPPLTPVRTLYWGRLQHPEGHLVYAVIPQPRPRALLTWNSIGSSLEFDEVEVIDREKARSKALRLEYPRAYTLKAGRDSASLCLEVENSAPAVESAFVDAEKAGRLDGRAIDLLARHPRGIKFFSRGRLLIRDEDRQVKIESAPFFSEYVRFG